MLKNKVLRSILGIVVFLVAAILIALIKYVDFRENLTSRSEIALTSKGEVEYQILGDDGPVILFLHGTPGGYDQFTRTDGYYARNSRYLVPSRPGYLRTSLDVGRTPGEQADAYAALLDSLSIDSVVVMAASGGGPSGLEFAIRYPDRTDALICLVALNQPEIGPPYVAPQSISFGTEFVYWLAYELLMEFNPRMVFSRIFDEGDLERVISDTNMLGRLKGIARAEFPVGWRTLGAENDQFQKQSLDIPFERIVVPTLIIHGTQDENIDYSQALELANRVNNSELHTIEGGDHFISFTHSDEISHTINEFFFRHNLLIDMRINPQ